MKLKLSILCAALLALLSLQAAGSILKDRVVHIPDPKLREEIYDALGMEPGDLTLRDMERLTTLNMMGDPPSSLEGLQYAVNLETLFLAASRAQYGTVAPEILLTPQQVWELLPHLPKLTKLTLKGFVELDLTQLVEYENLTMLGIDESTIKSGDLSPIAKLSNLELLFMLGWKAASSR